MAVMAQSSFRSISANEISQGHKENAHIYTIKHGMIRFWYD